MTSSNHIDLSPNLISVKDDDEEMRRIIFARFSKMKNVEMPEGNIKKDRVSFHLL